MWRCGLVKEVVRILMASGCYFELDLRERHHLIRYLLGSHSVVDLQ
jgi:hypothetical protein